MENENLTSQQIFERMLPCRDDSDRAEQFAKLNEKWRELFGKLSKELTDEQKVAVQAVRDAFEAARSLGVKFCWLSDHDMLQAISVNNLSDFKSSWERSELEEFEFVAEDNYVVNDLFCTDIQMYDFWLNCDSALGMSFK